MSNKTKIKAVYDSDIILLCNNFSEENVSSKKNVVVQR
jgi:hypothetical protein